MYERKKKPPEVLPELPPMIPPRSEEEAYKRGAGLAMDLALEQLRNHTASSQTLNFFLTMNSPKMQAELEKTREEIELLKAKKKAIELAEEQEKKYQEVIRAIATYSGKDNEWEVVEDDYEG